MATINQELELIEVAAVTVGKHEIIKWNDGSVTIEHWMYQFEPNNAAYDHQYLSPEQATALRSILQ